MSVVIHGDAPERDGGTQDVAQCRAGAMQQNTQMVDSYAQRAGGLVARQVFNLGQHECRRLRLRKFAQRGTQIIQQLDRVSASARLRDRASGNQPCRKFTRTGVFHEFFCATESTARAAAMRLRSGPASRISFNRLCRAVKFHKRLLKTISGIMTVVTHYADNQPPDRFAMLAHDMLKSIWPGSCIQASLLTNSRVRQEMITLIRHRGVCGRKLSIVVRIPSCWGVIDANVRLLESRGFPCE